MKLSKFEVIIVDVINSKVFIIMNFRKLKTPLDSDTFGPNFI